MTVPFAVTRPGLLVEFSQRERMSFFVVSRADLHHVRGKIANLVESVPGGHLKRHLIAHVAGCASSRAKMCRSGWAMETV